MPSGDSSELNFLLPQRGGSPEQKLFGRYTLKRVLGRGGMGIVWLAHDDELNRHVAMKFLPDMLIRDKEAVNDLKRETRRSLDLTHHHIVRIYDFTQDDVCAAIIMEYVDGETLSAMKTQQPAGCFSVSTIAAWVSHLCQALDYAHRQARVVHRDLKPANLMVNSRGDLKITDFGISRSMSDSMTRVSMSNTAGTLAYMSPEQALGAPPAACDDIYAFGATVYDLVTGRPPFFRGNIQVQLETVIPPKMAARREELGNEGEEIPEIWETIIASCLAKRPQDRPQSMGEIASLLGLSAPPSALRGVFTPGTAGTGASAPGTGSTRSRTAPTEDPATRTQALPPTPQTTRPAAGATRASGFRQTPRPTSLRDVIPGYIDEPVAPPPPTTTHGTTPAAEPEPQTIIVPPPVEAKVEPVIEPVIEPVVEPIVEQVVEPVVEPLIEPAPAVIPEAPEVAAEAPAEVIAPIPAEPEMLAVPEAPEEIVSVEIAPAVEPPIEDVPVEEVAPVIVEEPAPAVEPKVIEVPEPEIAPVILVEEPAPLEELAVAAQAEELEASQTILEGPIAPPTPVIATETSPVRTETETPAQIPPAPLKVERSPQRTKSMPWLPIAAVVGVVVVIGIWYVLPKGELGPKERVAHNEPTPVPAPTPSPVALAIDSKLKEALADYSNNKFTEAAALLHEVQALDPKNEEAASVLAKVESIQRERAAMETRQLQVDAFLDRARSAHEHQDWVDERKALGEALNLDPGNTKATEQLAALDKADAERSRVAEVQRQEAEDAARQKQIAAQEQARRDRERAAAAEERERERERAAQQQEKKTKPKSTASKPPRGRDEEPSDTPPRRPPVAKSSDQRPPAPTRTEPARPPAQPQPQPDRRPTNVFKGGAPGG